MLKVAFATRKRSVTMRTTAIYRDGAPPRNRFRAFDAQPESEKLLQKPTCLPSIIAQRQWNMPKGSQRSVELVFVMGGFTPSSTSGRRRRRFLPAAPWRAYPVRQARPCCLDNVPVETPTRARMDDVRAVMTRRSRRVLGISRPGDVQVFRYVPGQDRA